MKCFIALLVIVAVLPKPSPGATQGDIVKSWATTLGDELWRLSLALTKSDQIRMKYKQLNASVKKKNGSSILESSLRSVSTMLSRKIKAVKCIHAKAEQLAKEFDYSIIEDPSFVKNVSYCDAKYSNFENEYHDEPVEIQCPKFTVNNTNFMNVSLEKDSHFYNISVDTNISCVHVPTNIFYLEKDVISAILWSEDLTEVFKKNYKSDPSLSWQYFGSSHGILRFYPGMPWNRQVVADTYDCRVRSWYIEAATCSKDMIILFDVSGSMTGFKNYVARMTLKSILDTLSNNDFVNVFTFKNETHKVVSCFTGLVQATPENKKTIDDTLQPINDTIHRVPLEGSANLTLAYIAAFETLRKRREERPTDCAVNRIQGCNQLVMLITDYVPGNLSEVFETYNRVNVDGKNYTPVRVFTYLIGKEVTNVQETQSMACTNRGYFVHIHSVEEVDQQVLKYINVIARPMILQEDEPPPTWTHANLDETRTYRWQVSDDAWKLQDEDKLVTSVAIPAFDLKHNKDCNDAILLGVAGTDVPIDSISKLAQPHQLGVNGYSFIVSNNGYLLLHPLLRASIRGKLQENYNSVDFVEVEQVDDGKGPRELGEDITNLREYLVKGVEGHMDSVKVLFHYDDMRRIARVQHDYFFNQLEGTPFSMGISLPKKYGDTELLLKDNPLEAKQGKDLTGINVTDYFRFSYRVHPDWVYCKYHYLEGHETDNPEQEIWGFLVRLSNNNLDITVKQYADSPGLDDDYSNITAYCENMQQLDDDAYYCNEDLVKQLVFDGKLTTPFFEKWEATEREKNLAVAYNVSVRFIATASGLTRWHYIFDDDKNEKVLDDGDRIKNSTEKVFGDKYTKSIEETWYQAAVLQAMINKESLVVATELPVLDDTIKEKGTLLNDDDDITVTASYAIFYKDGESETPASVVGFEFSSKSLHERFKNITNRGPKEFRCGIGYDCYVIDSTGYIVISLPQNPGIVGQFFGVVNRQNGYVMQSLLDESVFDTVEIFNYQALCPESLLQERDCAWSLRTPFNMVHSFIKWLLAEMVIFVLNMNHYVFADEDIDYSEIINQGNIAAVTTGAPRPESNMTIEPPAKEENHFSCDHRISLYILNQTFFTESNGIPRVLNKDDGGECFPPYWAAYVPQTNMLLVVIEEGYLTNSNESCRLPADTKPRATNDSTTSREPCHKLKLGALFRRRLEGCYTYNEKEENITKCGRGHFHRSNPLIFLTSALLVASSYSLFT